jgi:hypothetical protein
MRQAAIEALADWPDGRAADDLLGVIVSAERREWKERALQGYLRLAGLRTTRPR